MPKHFHAHFPHYFSKHPSRSLIELFWSVGILDFATAAVSLFEPIFLFVIGYSLADIMLFYLIAYGCYVIFLPLGGKIAARAGYEHAIFYSQFFFIAYYLSLFAISQIPIFFFIAPVIFAVQKALYWPAFHADFAIFSQPEQRGREVSGIQTVSRIAYILGPVAAGLLLKESSFGWLFIGASILFLISTIPLFRIKEIHDTTSFSYKDVFRRLLNRTHRRIFFACIGFGEELIVLTLWPIFIYIVVKDFLQVGSLVALATIATTLLGLLVGKIVDKSIKDRVMSIGTIAYALSWIIRIFGKNMIGLFSMDTLSRFAKEFFFIPLIVGRYEDAKAEGALSYMVFFEQSLGVGKFLTALVLFIVLQFTTSWTFVFVFAGALTFLYLFFMRTKPVSAIVASSKDLYPAPVKK